MIASSFDCFFKSERRASSWAWATRASARSGWTRSSRHQRFLFDAGCVYGGRESGVGRQPRFSKGRSRFYRRQSLHFKFHSVVCEVLCFEIYRIYTRLHCSKVNMCICWCCCFVAFRNYAVDNSPDVLSPILKSLKIKNQILLNFIWFLVSCIFLLKC